MYHLLSCTSIFTCTWQYLGHNLGAHLPLSYRLRQAGWAPYPTFLSYLKVARLEGFLLWVRVLSPQFIHLVCPLTA